MLSFHAQLKVFVATAPCDLRLNFNGLWAAAQERLPTTTNQQVAQLTPLNWKKSHPSPFKLAA